MCGTDRPPVINRSTDSSVSVENGSNGNHQPEPVINLDHGDPTMYESYWKKLGEKCRLTIPLCQSLSYFANTKNLCWFLEPKLEQEIKILHNVVGNAVVEDHHFVVGTGSSQLIQAALYALSDSLDQPNPVSVVSAAPYYSSYQEIADFLRSGLSNGQLWLIKPEGWLFMTLPYYWPQYTAITSPADCDIMLFTVSKCTGHAGSRIGWALVRDKDVAKKMVKFIEINTIGVSKEAQLRAASILEIVSASCQRVKPYDLENFFEYSKDFMAERWKKLRDAVKKNELFSVTKFPRQFCNFTGGFTEAHPAFAWMKCKEGMDCEKVLREHKILTRSGKRFGSDEEYVRISMLSRDEEFDLFLQRLPNIIAEEEI
ncbi:UNVERIFIED_CONTAM: L-tryptophan--pyruvate aminotransferase 1 [Sesamum latifolium]|uniref:L-tryptophan--pyruvate aminotransferase 1 n=1 Tax=Sesamum latifolium TaxID=2727402 RepID=A0AAW2WZ09_9LAMI